MLLNPEMYEESSACFDPNSLPGELVEDGFSNCNNNNFSIEELSYHPNPLQEDASAAAAAAAAAAMEIELQQQLGSEMEDCYNPTNNHQNDTHLMQEVVHDSTYEMQDLGCNSHFHIDHPQQYHQVHEIQNGHNQTFNPPPPDLLNLFNLPRCSSSSLLPNSSISFSNPSQNPPNFASSSNVLYDPLFHLNLPPQPPLFRDLFQSLPHGYNLPGSRSGSLFDEREASGVYQDGDGSHHDSGVLEFTREMNCMAKGREGKDTKHFATERERRVNLNSKYTALRTLVPNPTKGDRASIVGDAIDYIKELLRTVNELKILVDKKRCNRERIQRHKTEDESALEGETINMRPHGDPDQAYNGSSLRSSWLQRKSKNTEIDVRIIDDEVTIKLVQQKRINCLLFVAKILDELQLDLHHVAGGLIGDYYSFLFNTKICEGSSVYASAIANKLIEVVDSQYAATPPTSSY